MNRIAERFAANAARYEQAARIQKLVAERLAGRLSRPASRILEIGCGTGLLSRHLRQSFPASELVLTDIAAPMLAQCRASIGEGPRYEVMDGEWPDAGIGQFDLIVSSLAVQWFSDLRAGLARLVGHLAPGGQLIFATLGEKSFQEWRDVHARLGLRPGVHDYPSTRDFPWPEAYMGHLDDEILYEPHADGRAFLHALKAIGAGTARPGYRPASPGALRRVLADTAGGFAVSYHVLYGEIIRPRA